MIFHSARVVDSVHTSCTLFVKYSSFIVDLNISLTVQVQVRLLLPSNFILKDLRSFDSSHNFQVAQHLAVGHKEVWF